MTEKKSTRFFVVINEAKIIPKITPITTNNPNVLTTLKSTNLFL